MNKLLVNFVIVNGQRQATPNTVVMAQQRHELRGLWFTTESGDLFKCRYARVAEKKQYGVDLVAIG